MGASYNLLICPSHQHLVMRPVWVRRADGGQWVHLGSVADAVAHVKRNGTDIFHTQVTRASNKGGTSKGWQFSFEDEIPHPPLVANAPPSSAPAVVSSFFHPTSSLPTCACCGDKLLGDIVTCTDCHHKVHVLCTQHGHCFKCACRVCNHPPGLDMRACKTCKYLVHTTCAVHIPFRVEVVWKVCTPRPREHPPPAKREKRRFRTKWQAGRPWLQHANGVMWCDACREYPEPGVQQSWVTGNRQLRRTTVKQHGNSGLHCKSLALWESGGTSTTVIGTLPAPIRRAINGLFQVVYRMAKRGSPPAHIPGDAEALMLSGGTVVPAYHSPSSVRQIVHAITAPIRSVEGQAIETSLFIALASDSSTDRSANKQELVYTRTLCEAQFYTAFLGFWELRDGTAPSSVAAYKQTTSCASSQLLFASPMFRQFSCLCFC